MLPLRSESKAKQNKKLANDLSLSCSQGDTFGQLCPSSGLVLLHCSPSPHTERIKDMNRNSASLSERVSTMFPISTTGLSESRKG